MQQLKIHCFGNLKFEKDGHVITQFDTDKSRALLVYLAVENRRQISRSHLAGLLWSDLSEKQALQSLRQTLSILRKSIGEIESGQNLVISERDLLQLNPDISVWIDVLAFRDQLSEAYRHFQRQDQIQQLNLRRLIKALAMRVGVFLENFSIAGAPLFDEWVSLIREDLDHRAVEGLAFLVHYYQNRDDLGLARQTAQRILEITPWDESAHLMMMRLYAMDEQWSALENQYRLLRHFLKDQLGVEPAEKTITFFEEVRQKRSKASVLHTNLSSNTNLPKSKTLFIGREKELDEITDLLVNPGCRLVTLHGPGGIGKTSLAVEVARQQLGVYRDGVFLISLSAIQSSDEIITAIVDVLKIPMIESSDMVSRFSDFLRSKHLLLIMDNYEHLLDGDQGTQILTEILQLTHSINILVTSRERLNLADEWVYPLQGMNYPGLHLETELNNHQEYDALALFYQRARQVKPDFQLDPVSLPAVIRICQLFGGLPLGIELAAAYVWSHSCQSIAEKISENVNTLKNSARDVPSRTRSLWANLDVSWQLMNKHQQVVFSRLGIFEDGFTLSAATAVGKAEEDLLTKMVNQSLLQHNSNGRYTMHGVIQQYAREKLQTSEFLRETQEAFLDYFCNYLADRQIELMSPLQKQGLEGIQSEISNLKQVWHWMLLNQKFEEINSWVDPLFQFFNIRSRFQEGIDLLQPAIDVLKKLTEDTQDMEIELLYGKTLARYGTLAHYIRQNNLARESLQRAFMISDKYSRKNEQAFCRTTLSDIYLRAKDFEEARTCAQKNLDYYRQSGEVKGEAQAFYLLGLIDLRLGKIQTSKQYLLQAIETARKTNDPRRLIAPLNLLGDIYCNEGNYDGAEVLFQESLNLATDLNDLFQKAILLNNLASVYHVLLQYPKASEMYAKSLAICRQIGDQDGEAIALTNLGEVALALGDFAGAISLSEQGLKITREIGEEWSISVCLNNLAEAAVGMGDCVQSMKYLEEAIQIAWKIKALRSVTYFAVTAGRCFQMQGCNQEAKELYEAALAHSSTEHEIREKAMGWMEEMGNEVLPESDDERLGMVIQRFFLADNM